MHGQVNIVAGWLIEGLLDVQKLGAALDRLVSKWPMLAGRLESANPVYVRTPFIFSSKSPVTRFSDGKNNNYKIDV